jgi:hypothetical protein
MASDGPPVAVMRHFDRADRIDHNDLMEFRWQEAIDDRTAVQLQILALGDG